MTIRCPLRSPDKRARSWEEIVEEQKKAEAARPYHCRVNSRPGKAHLVRSESVNSFWEDIKVAQSFSIYRDYSGIVSVPDGIFYPPDFFSLPPGEYTAVGRTIGLTDNELFGVLDDAKEVLNAERPLVEDKVMKVHNNLSLLFNHFSLKHEGSNLGLDETEMITNLLGKKDSKHQVEEDEIGKIVEKVPGSEYDIVEAVNHILVSEYLPKMAKNVISETMVLQLHSAVMDGLLTNVEEGMAGEYRKVSINVMGDSSLRPNFADIPPLMASWCEKDLIQKEGEHIIEYLSRIHSKFQDIHPFRDGNGRVGRLLMNIILLQQDYPVLAFAPSLSLLFNNGVNMGVNGNCSLFSRLLAEVLFSSFQAYEDALGVKMLPSVEESVKFKSTAVSSVVTP